MRSIRLALALFLGLSASSSARAVCTPPDCALAFGASNAFVTFGNTSALGLPVFTLETWFLRQGTGTAASTGTGGVSAIPLVTKGRGQADGSNLDMNYFLGIRASDGVLVADFEEGAGGSSPGLNHPVAGVTPIANGTWYHAAATYDGTTWKLYLNGQQEASLAVGQPVRSDSIQHAGLASALDSTGAAQGAFNGTLDEVRIWSTARTQAQIFATINQEVVSDATLVARWGLNEGSGTAVGDSSGTAQNGTLSGTGHSWVPGFNLPPAAPTPLAPANAATGVALPPSLQVSVSDPDSDPLDVTFFGRQAGVAAPDFSVIALPDTQFYVSSLNGGSPAIMNSQTQWIVNNLASRNIRYVAQLGDCVQNGDNSGNPIEWQNADAAFDLIENPLTTLLTDGIPYGIAVGNHDQSPQGNPDGTTTFYNQFFGESRFLGRAYYGGHYGSNNDNHYDLFSASGMDFIAITFEYDTTPDAAVLTWANNLLQTHAGRRAIVTSHHIVNTGNPATFGAQGQGIYDALKANPNLFLMLSGHVCNGSPPNISPEGLRQDTFNGKTVYSMLSDYQCDTAGGNGWLRILTFRPQLNQIQVETYSPWLSQFRTGALSQFTVPYDMGGAGFTQIATNPGVTGSTTQAPWPGLANTTSYEWYASADDGSAPAVNGPVWSFTTAAASVCGDGDVAGAEQCDDGDTQSGDGCSATCQIESCYACNGEPSACAPTPGSPCASDGNLCTDDVCDAFGGCGVPNTAPCDDGVFCNGADLCSGGVCTHAGDPCAGGSECNNACNESVDNCADLAGTACTPDANVCTNDVCNGAGLCGTHNTAPCDDADACTSEDLCSAGTCAPGAPVTACSSGDGCCPAGCSNGNDGDCAAPVIPAFPPLAGLILGAAIALAARSLSRSRRVR